VRACLRVLVVKEQGRALLGDRRNGTRLEFLDVERDCLDLLSLVTTATDCKRLQPLASHSAESSLPMLTIYKSPSISWGQGGRFPSPPATTSLLVPSLAAQTNGTVQRKKAIHAALPLSQLPHSNLLFHPCCRNDQQLHERTAYLYATMKSS